MIGSIKSLNFYFAAAFCLIAGFMMFLPAMEINGIDYRFYEIYFMNDYYNPVPFGFVGFILLLIAATLLVPLGIFTTFNIKVKTWIEHMMELSMIIILFAGMILVFCVKPMFLLANGLHDINETYQLGIGPMVAGFNAMVAAACASIGLIFPG